MPAEPLPRKDIDDRLGALPGWTEANGRITRSYRLGSHFAATAMVVHIARIQEELNHHSELTLGYNTVSLAVSTHDAGDRITERDFRLAGRVEEIAAVHGAG